MFDKKGDLRYKIEGKCCQAGWLCRGYPCDDCQKMKFEVYDSHGTEVTTLNKKSPGCLKSMISDADNFKVKFPKDATKEDKCLIMASTIMIDYMYFEESPTGGAQGTTRLGNF